MKIGTRSLLFGAHQVFIHPWFVAWAWWKLYGFPMDFRLWIAFIIHDWGYWGKPNMDGAEGELHPYWAAKIMSFFDDQPGGHWHDFTLYHSRFLAKLHDKIPSRLCAADKLAIGLTPAWLYLPLTWLSRELPEYMEGKAARTPAGNSSAWKWYADVRRYCTAWAWEHRDCRTDTWTGTKRDLISENNS